MSNEIGPKPKKSRRLLDVMIVLVVAGGLAAAAYYQEPILCFFKLRMWDSGAPGRTLHAFGSALKAGDRQAADRYIGSGNIQPLMRGERWSGYHISGLGFKNDMDLADLAPGTEIKAGPPDYSVLDGGSAQIRMPNGRGQPVLYRLKMIDGAWKIVDIKVGV
jgi:hypothetical protein